MANFTFDELLAKREQRKADKLKVTEISVPNSDKKLLVKMPTDAKLMHFFGCMAYADGAFEPMLTATDEIIYHSCAQLQDQKLRDALGVVDPLDVVPALFTVPERNAMGQQMMKFLGVLTGDDEDAAEPVKN